MFSSFQNKSATEIVRGITKTPTLSHRLRVEPFRLLPQCYLSMSIEGPGSEARTASLGAGCAQNRIPSPSLVTEPPLQGKSWVLLCIPSVAMICRITLRQPMEFSILHEPQFPREGGGDPLGSAFKCLLVFL